MKYQFLNGKRHWKDSGDLAMMFKGTYTSDFYRAVRDLLHDQVCLKVGDAPAASAEHSPAERALERRWQELLSRENEYRSGEIHAAALAGDVSA